MTIPQAQTIRFNTAVTDIGAVGLAAARLEPDHQVIVAAAYDKLKDQADSSKTIAYTPVSYTHLDVYKRQGVARLANNHSYCRQ